MKQTNKKRGVNSQYNNTFYMCVRIKLNNKKKENKNRGIFV